MVDNTKVEEVAVNVIPAITMDLLYGKNKLEVAEKYDLSLEQLNTIIKSLGDIDKRRKTILAKLEKEALVNKIDKDSGKIINKLGSLIGKGLESLEQAVDDGLPLTVKDINGLTTIFTKVGTLIKLNAKDVDRKGLDDTGLIKKNGEEIDPTELTEEEIENILISNEG